MVNHYPKIHDPDGCFPNANLPNGSFPNTDGSFPNASLPNESFPNKKMCIHIDVGTTLVLSGCVVLRFP